MAAGGARPGPPPAAEGAGGPTGGARRCGPGRGVTCVPAQVRGQAAPLRAGDRVPALRGGGRWRPHLAGVPGPAGEQRGSGLSAGAGPLRRRDPPLEAAGTEGRRLGAAARFPRPRCLLVRLRGCLAEVPLPGPLQQLHSATLQGQLPQPPLPPSRSRGRRPPTLPVLEVRVSPSCLLQSPGLGAAPEATQDRIRAIQEKIAERQRILSLPQHFAGSKSLSRREMEIENALFQGTDRHSFLRMLYRQGTVPVWAEGCVGLVPVPGPTGQELPLPLVLQMKLRQRLPLRRAQRLSWTRFIGSS